MRFVLALVLACFLGGYMAQPATANGDTVAATATKVVEPLELPNMHNAALARGGTRLPARDSVIICANDDPGAVVSGKPECVTIRNETDLDYFIPWRTPAEYAAFLKSVRDGTLTGVSLTDHCKPKSNIMVCGSIVLKQLGSRPAGFIDGEEPFYGAQDDVVGPVDASVVLGNETINFKTTFVCDKTEWVQTHSSGSCVPMDGACSGLTAVVANEGGWPANDGDLCKEGSIIENLAVTYTDGHPTGWSWVCKGTPGRSSASCSAAMIKPVSGKCGDIDGKTLEEPPQPDALCSAGTPSVSFFPKTATVWNWTCAGQLNGPSNIVSCRAENAKPAVDATCTWVGNGWVYPDIFATPKVTSGGICGKGSIYHPVTGVSDLTEPDLTQPGPYYTRWTCYGINGGADKPCYARLRTDGYCGIENWRGFPRIFSDWEERPRERPDRDLCRRVGNQPEKPRPLSGPFFNEEDNKFTWICPGSLDGPDSKCVTTYIPEYKPVDCGDIRQEKQTGLYNPITKRMEHCYNGNCGYYPLAYARRVEYPSGVDDFICKNSDRVYYHSFSYERLDWEWSCENSRTGQRKWCTAKIANPTKDGVCGAASGSAGVISPDTANLCAYPAEQPPYALEGANYVWKCPGTNGGASVDCFAPALQKVDAICGAASGTYIPDAPNKKLCDAGQPTDVYAGTVSGENVFRWNCDGVNGGKSASCLAYRCQACAGEVRQTLSGSANADVTRFGCTLSGGLNWTSKYVRLRNTGISLSGNVSGLGELNSEMLSLSAAQDKVCPPCVTAPSGGVSGVFTPAGYAGNCGQVEKDMVGRTFNILNLTVN